MRAKNEDTVHLPTWSETVSWRRSQKITILTPWVTGHICWILPSELSVFPSSTWPIRIGRRPDRLVQLLPPHTTSLAHSYIRWI
ncbi:hypothetical protein TNCT_105071 [Trichonephila clavata]|uniref:Uncharacterized protein n=1 Tax=Trichonephila clavata TaxID=2740835 RepID=A0A8X6HH91_TRICU|nr:hypothetical protein TNCT_105071 [Trichonephila clavata]